MKRPNETAPTATINNNDDIGAAVETIDTLIGSGSKLKGDLEFTGGIRIDGQIKGTISTKEANSGTLVLSESGLIDGDINVPNLVINGIVNGNINSSGHVELQANAKVTGDIRYAALEIGLGAALNGSLVSNTVAKTSSKNSEPAYDLISGGAEKENA